MPRGLQEEIKQSRPFRSREEEAYLTLVRTADVLTRTVADQLKDFNISETQYNVLRILRGAGPDGHPCSEVGARLLTRDPDVTRLLDRLEKRGLISRARDASDRRVVTIRITADGLSLLEGLDAPMRDMDGLLSHLGQERLTQLIDLLNEARAGSIVPVAAPAPQPRSKRRSR